MNQFTNPFAAFNPFGTNKEEPKATDAFSNPFMTGNLSNIFDFNAMKEAMQSGMQQAQSAMQKTMSGVMPQGMPSMTPPSFSSSANAASDLFQNWQKAWQNLMGDFSDGLHNPSGPFGSVKPDMPLSGMMSGMMPSGKLYNVDWSALAASQKRNMEAVQSANHAAMASLQQIAKRQSDILRDTMQAAGQLMTDLMATGTPEEKLARQADIALAAVNMAGKHMRELAEMATQSQHEALDLMEGRLKDGLDELKQMAQASGAQFHEDVKKAEAAKKTAQKTAAKTASASSAAFARAAENLPTEGDTLN